MTSVIMKYIRKWTLENFLIRLITYMPIFIRNVNVDESTILFENIIIDFQSLTTSAIDSSLILIDQRETSKIMSNT